MNSASKTDLNSFDRDIDKELNMNIREYREASLPRITEQNLNDLNKEARESYENMPIEKRRSPDVSRHSQISQTTSVLNKFQNRLAEMKNGEEAVMASRSQLEASIAETASRTDGGNKSNMESYQIKNKSKLKEYICMDNLGKDRTARNKQNEINQRLNCISALYNDKSHSKLSRHDFL